ncbi:hypothetical protein ACEOB3_06905 [Aeromonas dhakensis]|uniref:hypothetical protein n=1 Tax=Aeromonas dhakensis TaxID=196024 RepID=UPI00358DC84C
MQLAAYSSGQPSKRRNAATQQRSNAATQQRSNAATQQRSNAATSFSSLNPDAVQKVVDIDSQRRHDFIVIT